MRKRNYEDLTILVPSKGRPNEISALLNYFDAKKINCKIIILESGTIYRNIIKNFSRIEIEHHEFDPNIPFSHKLLKGSLFVKTPLVCLCTDDDLVLKEGIDESAEFLLGAPEYSAAQGYHALFEKKDSAFYLYNILWFTPSLDSDEPLLRLQNLICRYHPVCWSVFRTDVFQRMHREFLEIKTFLFFELYWSAMAALCGKVKRVPSLYCLRAKDEIHPTGHPLFLFAESPENFCQDYLTYRSSLEKVLSRIDAKSRRLLDLMHACLFYSAAPQGALQYIANKAMENPDSSILQPEIYNQIKFPLPCFDEKASLLITHKGRKYYFAEKFLHPEPVEEIRLSKNFHLKLLNDLASYPLLINSNEMSVALNIS